MSFRLPMAPGTPIQIGSSVPRCLRRSTYVAITSALRTGGVRELPDGLSCLTGDDEDVAHARRTQT
jgi:hypothetical protein